jgi:hypothetical protein
MAFGQFLNNNHNGGVSACCKLKSFSGQIINFVHFQIIGTSNDHVAFASSD